MSHKKTFKDVVDNAVKARQELYTAILNLPKNDAESMKKVGKNSFTMNMSEIIKDGGNMTPAFHLFEQQYKLIVEVLKTTQMHKVMDRLQEMIDKKTVIHLVKNVQNRQGLHPKVIGHLKKLIE